MVSLIKILFLYQAVGVTGHHMFLNIIILAQDLLIHLQVIIYMLSTCRKVHLIFNVIYGLVRDPAQITRISLVM